jgi:hypothetical protein
MWQIKKVFADYEKPSDNKIDFGITPSTPLGQKMATGVVPDLFPANPFEIIALYAWNDN